MDREWEQSIEEYLAGIRFAGDHDESRWLYKGAALGFRMLGDDECDRFFETVARTDGENVTPVERCYLQ